MARSLRFTSPTFALIATMIGIASCASEDVPESAAADAASTDSAGKADDPHAAGRANRAAEALSLYEVQVRTANACRTDVGSPAQRSACEDKVAPTPVYHGEGVTCGSLDDLEAIRLGTLDDLTEDTADFHEGITLRYIDERVGATAVWLMPLFPNNDAWDLPDACDNLGSPYAVRDYLHVAASLSRACITKGKNEASATPCWGDNALDDVIADAHARGLKVMLDVAFNHFGHNYLFYDLGGVRPVRDRIAAGEDLDGMWDFEATYDPALLTPEVIDTPAKLTAASKANAATAADLKALKARCPALTGQPLVRGYAMWREALDWERATFPCEAPSLEFALPGFYLGTNHVDPSTGAGDNYSNEWRDVKFLYHHSENLAHRQELVREREYLVRILDYWTSRGVDGFRLDHTTDFMGGMVPEEWHYIVEKVAFYAGKRGQARPTFLAEEFADQQGMADVVDILTEGYVRDMCGREGVTKNAGHVEWVVANMARFGDRATVMSALETHDEKRLVDGTGFDAWTGAGFWGIGASTWSVPMMLMGQEFGESYGLAFRRSDFLRARFQGSGNDLPDGDALVDFYGAMNRARQDSKNRALRSKNGAFLRTRSGATDQRLFAQVKWSSDGNVVFTFNNLWRQSVAQSYFIPPELASALSIRDDRRYQLVDALAGGVAGTCRTGAELKWDLYVSMNADTRLQWLRLETCD